MRSSTATCAESWCAAQLRVADVRGEIPPQDGELYELATSNPPGLLDLVVHGCEWRAAEIPAANGHGTAESVARFYAGLLNGGALDGVRLVSPAIVEAMTVGELTAVDLLLQEEATWGLSVGVDVDGHGMGGLGGSLGLADPALRLAEACLTRQMGTHEAGRRDGRRRPCGSVLTNGRPRRNP
jgi:CubicO group peptidase (beta-lactamase class C family)